jgi:hypothetical protein
LDVSKIDSSKLGRNKDVLHNIETALAGRVKAKFVNTVGLALVFHPCGQIDLVGEMTNNCVFLIGKPGSGKTNLLHHVAGRFPGMVFVLDAKKRNPAKWPGCSVTGPGGDYEAIDSRIEWLQRQMHKRDLSNEPWLIIVDDLPQLHRNITDAAKRLMSLYDTGREANMIVILASQADAVGAIGLESFSRYRDDFVRVEIDLVGNNRVATINLGNGPQPVDLPGLFPGLDGGQTIETKLLLTNDERKLVEYACHRLDNSFAINKLVRVVPRLSPGWSGYKIQELAKRWEGEGLLTSSDARNDKGHLVGRQVTKLLARAAGCRDRGV